MLLLRMPYECVFFVFFFFFNDTATTEIYTSFPTRRSSDLARLCQHLRARHHMIDEPDPLGLLALQQRATDQKLLRLVDANEQRPDHGAAVAGDQADARDMRVANAGVFGHDSNIAEQGVSGRKPDGVAID